MYVSDIINEAVELTGICATDPLLFKKISRAVKSLANKGNWDAQQLYMDIPVQPGEVVILPREVLCPIQININKNPAFSRTRLYEFSLMGPGEETGGLTGWQWMDQNTVPIMIDLPPVGSVLQVLGDIVDNDKKIRFFGLDINNNEIEDEIILDGTLQATTGQYKVVRRVRKDKMAKKLPVTLPNGDAVANYYGDEVEPRYRKIKLAKKATSIHMLFRRTTLEVTSADDYIPLDSEQAILFMLKARDLTNSTEGKSVAEAEALEKKAIQELQDEQTSRNAHAALADANEIQPALNLNTNNRDSLIAADVIDDVFEIFGPIGLPKALDKITDAIELLNNKSPSWEAQEGYIDLNVGVGGTVTLPRYVSRPIKINMGCGPLRARNRFFEFHLNGPGSECGEPCGHWDDLGESVTIADPALPFRLVALNDLDSDDGATIRIYGYDDGGRWIRTPNPDTESDDNYIDGMILTASYANTLPDPQTPRFKRITRITRDKTDGYQQLLAYYDEQTEPVMVGYYYPDETEPKYSRIKLPTGCNPQWIRMRYRKRGIKISALTEPLHLSSRLAVDNALRALKAGKEDIAKAEAFELKAVERLKEKESANNPSQVYSFECGESFGDPLQGQF